MSIALGDSRLSHNTALQCPFLPATKRGGKKDEAVRCLRDASFGPRDAIAPNLGLERLSRSPVTWCLSWRACTGRTKESQCRKGPALVTQRHRCSERKDHPLPSPLPSRERGPAAFKVRQGHNERGQEGRVPVLGCFSRSALSLTANRIPPPSPAPHPGTTG